MKVEVSIGPSRVLASGFVTLESGEQEFTVRLDDFAVLCRFVDGAQPGVSAIADGEKLTRVELTKITAEHSTIIVSVGASDDHELILRMHVTNIVGTILTRSVSFAFCTGGRA
jgi:hypothetical protein